MVNKWRDVRNSKKYEKGTQSRIAFCDANSHSVQLTRQRAMSSGYLSHVFNHCGSYWHLSDGYSYE